MHESIGPSELRSALTHAPHELMRNSHSPSSPVLSSLLLIGLSPALAAQAFEEHKLLPTGGLPGDRFGATVATDGDLVGVGASGSAYLFDAPSGAQELELAVPAGALGFGASISVDGDVAAVGAPLTDDATGAVYVFDTTSGALLLEVKPNDSVPGAQFGTSVALDGGHLVVGALQAAYLFDAATGLLLEELVPDGGPPIGGTGIATIDGGFGQAVDIDAGLIVVGAKTANGASLYSGAAYVFDTEGDELQRVSAGAAWTQFGGSVGIDGTTVVVGAKYSKPNGKDSGQAYLFDVPTGALVSNLVPDDGHIFAHFGSSVGIDGPLVVIGAEQDNGVGTPDSGAAYVYTAEDGSFVAKLTASDAASLDDLGTAVAAAKGVIVAGATGDDDNGGSSGSAYLFGEAGTVTAMSECIGNAGVLEHVSGLALAGQTLVFRASGAQPGATASALFASAAPAPGWPGCGIDLGGAGELLVDLTLPPLLTLVEPWTGAATDFAVPVPPTAGLVGLQVYWQGIFAGTGLAEPLRLTRGLEVTFGGYL